jgi:hypothetical protein
MGKWMEKDRGKRRIGSWENREQVGEMKERRIEWAGN